MLGKLAIPNFAHPRHVQLMEKTALDMLYDEKFNRLCVTMSVRHGKSFFYSYLYPCWYLLTHQDKKVMIVSHGREFSIDWSSRVKQLLTEFGPQFGCELDPNFKSKTHFRLKNNSGELYALGINGALAGRGYDLCICDDIIASEEEVLTQEAREKLFTKFHGELLTRGEPHAKTILVMSCRHPQDLSERLMSQNHELSEKDKWHNLRLPAISTDEDGTEHALWPERYSLERLKRIRKDFEIAGKMYQWHCLFQQDPRADTSLLEWESQWFDGCFYEKRPDVPIRHRVVSLDPSKGSGKSKKGDFAALLHVVYDEEGSLWVEDSVMARTNTETLEDYSIEFLRKFKPDAMIVESNLFQEVIAKNIQLKADAQGLRCKIYKHINTQPKESRIRHGLTHLLAKKRIRFRDTPSNRLGVSHMMSFPESYDDFPDSLQLATVLLDKLGRIRKVPIENIRYQV